MKVVFFRKIARNALLLFVVLGVKDETISFPLSKNNLNLQATFVVYFRLINILIKRGNI